jgi:PAS domain S-box-containing protein/putative nucleotidyltransferase with HDIG domain
MKKTPKSKKSTTDRESGALPEKKTVAPKGQRVEQKTNSVQAVNDPEIYYRSLFENMLNGVAYCKMSFELGEPQDFTYLEVNSAFESLTRLKNVIGRNVSEVIPGIKKSDPDLFELYGRVALTGNPERFETYVKALNEWFLISVYSPRKEYFIAVFDVITERKQTEEALRSSESRYKSLFENSPIALWEEDFSGVKELLDALRTAGITDFEEYFKGHPEVVTECAALIKVLDVNKAALRMLGAEQKEDLLKGLRSLLPVKPDNSFKDELLNIANGKTRFDWEGINQTLNGRLINVELNWSIAPGYEDSLSKVIISMIDITRRKQAEEQRTHLVAIVETSDDAIIGKTLEGIITSWNPGAQRLYGYSAEEAIGKPISMIIPPDHRDELPEILTRLMDGERVEHFETVRLRKDGRRVDVSITVSPIKDASGRVTGASSIGRDITERKQAEARIKLQLEHLTALREIDRVIASSFDLHYNLTWILESVTKELGLDAADILLLNPVSSQLEFGGEIGFRAQVGEKAFVRPSHSLALRVIMDRQLVHVPNLQDGPKDLLPIKMLTDEAFVCYFGMPLIAKGSVKGVLEVYQRSPFEPDQDWLDFFNTLGGQAALAIDNAGLFDNLQRSNIELTLAYDATIEGWSHAMDLRDKETEGHTLRVMAVALELAALFGFKDEEMVGIRRGALLHDIGKIGVPDAILLKPGKLTEEEWLVMKKHPILAFEMLSPIRYLQSSIDIPYCHHEKWDGSGYPRGLKGEQIPLAARIFSIVDVWDALTSDRPYRSAWPNDKVLEYLRSEAGKSFDPQVVKTCLDAGVFERKPKIGEDQ